MRLLVTGGTGFIGKAVVTEARERGAVVGLLSRESKADCAACETFVLGSAPWSLGAVSDAIARFEPNAILHLAGGPSAASLETLYEDNVFLGARLIEAARRAAPSARVIVVGSAAEYGTPSRLNGMVAEDDPARPMAPYGIAKLAQTLHACSAERAGQMIVVARLFNPVGPGMPPGLAFSDFARQISAGASRLLTGDLDTERDFMPVWEAARILVDLAVAPSASGLVNVCSGLPQTVRGGLDTLLSASGRKIEVELNTSFLSRSAVRTIFGDTRRLRSFGIEPASPEIGTALRRMLS